jgi:hypothetical protein
MAKSKTKTEKIPATKVEKVSNTSRKLMAKYHCKTMVEYRVIRKQNKKNRKGTIKKVITKR